MSLGMYDTMVLRQRAHPETASETLSNPPPAGRETAASTHPDRKYASLTHTIDVPLPPQEEL